MNQDKIINILSEVDSNGYLKSRESSWLEFKESFNLGQLADYLKAIASFANAKGGFIVFGVKDSPRLPIGIDRARFEEIRQERITTYLNEYLAPEIIWDIGGIETNNLFFGYIHIEECVDKPVICKKSYGGTLRDGDIYYRYRGQSRLVSYPELKKIQDDIRHRERDLWMGHIERIAKIGPKNVAFLDLFEGAIKSGKSDAKLIIDPNLLSSLKQQVKFIEEGSFVERDGAPTLKVVGQIIQSDGIVVPDMDPNRDYPFLVKQLAEELKIRRYDVLTMIWKLKLKESKKYHISIQTGKNNSLSKYSRFALQRLEEELISHPDKHEYLNSISQEYQSR